MAWIRGMSSPGSMTMASCEVSSPRMEQLHWRRPTGRISWIIGLKTKGLTPICTDDTDFKATADIHGGARMRVDLRGTYASEL